jgi:hypothetical protein
MDDYNGFATLLSNESIDGKDRAKFRKKFDDAANQFDKKNSN